MANKQSKSSKIGKAAGATKLPGTTTTPAEVHNETPAKTKKAKAEKTPKAPKVPKERKPAVFKEKPKTAETESESRLAYFSNKADHMSEKDLMLLEPLMAKDAKDMTAREIADEVGLNANQVSGALSVLVPKGLVETVKVRREGEKGVVRVVRMTDHGRKVYRKCEAEAQQEDDQD